MMKAVRLHSQAWTPPGTGPAGGADGIAGVGPASRPNQVVVHGAGAEPPVQGLGPVSDLALHPQAGSRRGRRPPQNVDIPPVTFPGGRNPYLDRPLPPPPFRRNVAAAAAAAAIVAGPTKTPMPARPSTSSGPGSSKTAGTRPALNANKRISKDDLALTGRAGVGGGKGLQPYVGGVKGLGLYTPEPSPHRMRMPPPSPAPSPAARLPTPQSSTSVEMQIGMALGSPTRDSVSAEGHHPGSPYAGWKPQSQAAVHIGHSSPAVQTPEAPLQRTKTQKRRLFGSLFGAKKHTEPVTTTSEPVDASRSTSSQAARSGSLPARSNTVSARRTPKHKPIVIRSDVEPGFGLAAHDPGPPSISEPVPAFSASGPGLLNIEIPDIRLERYSVMFSGLLNPDGTRSTLLERRQATLERLKPISDRVESEEDGKDRPRQRRATSPQPIKSPAFTLFPQAASSRPSGTVAATGAGMSSTTSLVPPRGLARSNTSPAYLPSPSRANFELEHHPPLEQTPRKEKKTVTIVSPRTMDERNRAAKVEKLREHHHQQHQTAHLRSQLTATAATSTTSLRFGPDESSLILDSPRSISSSSSFSSSFSDLDVESERPGSETLASLRPPFKPTLAEPQWEIITPVSSASTSGSSASAGSAVTTTASTATTTSLSKRSVSASTASSSSSTSTTTTAAAAVSSSSSSSASSTAARPSVDAAVDNSNINRGLGGRGPSRAAPSSTSSPASSSSPPSSSAVTTTSSSAKTDNPRVSVDEADAALKAAVEISIARQISISRQQRMLLRPLGVAGAGMGQTASHSAASPGNDAGTGTGTGTGNGYGPGKALGRSATVGAAAHSGAAARRPVGGNGNGNGLAQSRGQLTVGVIKGRVAPVLMVGGGGGAADRRSERVVLDVA